MKEFPFSNQTIRDVGLLRDKAKAGEYRPVLLEDLNCPSARSLRKVIGA